MEALTVDITSEIRSVNNQFESNIAAGNASAMADLYTEDGMLLPAGSEIIRGKEGIAGYWQSAFDMGVKQVKLDSVDVENHGNTAIELGNYTISGEGGQVFDQGKYIVVWKMVNDQWRLQKDIWNSNVAVQH